MEVEDWEAAAKAYRRYCALNSEVSKIVFIYIYINSYFNKYIIVKLQSFEAWNNLAKCYAKLGQKSRAWSALQEAVKCQYETWKVWYMALKIV